MSVHFSKKSDEWETPQSVFDPLNKEFGFRMDVCATKQNAKTAAFMSIEGDGLSMPWPRTQCWCNPPYSELGNWIEYAAFQAHMGSAVVLLIPARTDTRAWHKWIWDGDRHQPQDSVEVRLLKGRIKFVGAKHSAPFPSAVVVFHPYRPIREESMR